MTLWDLAPGTMAFIAGYDKNIEDSFAQRLADLGFSVGSNVECLRHAPFAGPHVFQLANSVFALEKEIAIYVLLTIRAANE